MAGSATKVGPKYQVTIPKQVREAIGLRVGDLVEASAQGGVIILRPKVLVDREHVRATRSVHLKESARSRRRAPLA